MVAELHDVQLVMLDRDGVINQDSPDYVKNAGEWYPIDGSIDAIAKLSQAGIVVCIATNQAGIGRGLFTEEDLDGIHKRLLKEVNAAGGTITYIAVCPHHPDERCQCRKPAPGMLIQLGRVTGLSIAGQPFVGDSERDVEAAHAAGSMPIIVRTGNGVKTARKYPTVQAFDDLATFADCVITNRI